MLSALVALGAALVRPPAVRPRAIARLVAATDDVTVRTARASEFESVAELCVESFVTLPQMLPAALTRPRANADWAAQLQKRHGGAAPHTAMLVATRLDAPQVLGCAELGLLPPPPMGEAGSPRGPDCPYLANIAVSTAARRAGVGSKLMAAAEDMCREWGFDKIFCKVERSNIPARRLYDGRGYKLVFLQQRGADLTNRQEATLFLCKDLEGDGESSSSAAAQPAAAG